MSGQSVHVQTSAGAKVKGIFHTSLAFPGKDFLLCLKAAAEGREFGHAKRPSHRPVILYFPPYPSPSTLRPNLSFFPFFFFRPL